MRFHIFIKTIILFLIAQQGYSQFHTIETELHKGNYSQVIQRCERLLQDSVSNENRIVLWKFINEANSNLNYIPEYLLGIKKVKHLDQETIRSDSYYYNELANYYHQQKKMDSAIFYSNKALELLRKNPMSLDTHLKYRIYSVYANCNRNRGVKGFNKITPLSMSFEERNHVLIKYLDTSLSFTTNNYEKEAVYSKKAIIYLDYVAQYQIVLKRGDKKSLLSIRAAFEKSNNFYKWIVKNSSNRVRIANAYSLMGLNHHYLNKFYEADQYYQKSLENIIDHDTIRHLYSYINTMKWKGWNLDIWYNTDGDLGLLDKSIQHYRDNVKYWKIYFNRKDKSYTGEHDGYRTGAISKLAVSLAKKYLITGDITLLNESFKYADESKYPNYPNHEYSIEAIQERLNVNEAFVQNVTATNPQQELIYLIDKEDINVILNEDDPFSLAYFQQIELYQFNDLELFKRKSYGSYQSKFEKADSILADKGINKVIISNSDYNALLNYDLLIRDTLSSKWKDQPYLFHDYNFTYALCVRSFLEDYKLVKDLPTRLGITIGDFKDDIDLRFSKKLVQKLESSYNSEQADFFNSLENNNMVLLLAHGNSQYENEIGEIRTSKTQSISVDDIFQKKLHNDFVIITTCNSNASQINYSEGASGNFSKALRFSGVASTLTTSWEIDDRSNAMIMERFVDHLANGLPKNEALWKAKKEFWNNATEEERKPLYWAPYILTGNVDPITINRKEHLLSIWWVLLALIPIGYYLVRKNR